MEDLTGGIVQIVLNVNEGQGFGSFNTPLLITANLNGHKLDSEIVPANPNPFFGTDLVWEAEKKTVKRLRTINTVIKLEFFSCASDTERTRIGFILINLKTAQIISKKNNFKLVESWHKLLGVQTVSKANRPEVLLSLRIEDILKNQEADRVQNSNSDLNLKSSKKKDEKEVNKNSGSKDKEISDASEKPYIQIGPIHLTHEIFLFTVIVGPIFNLLEYLSKLNISSTNNCIHLAYSIFGEFVCTSPISDSSFHSRSNHFVKSSYSFLNSYFLRNSCLSLTLCHGTSRIGSLKIDLKPFICGEKEFYNQLNLNNFIFAKEKVLFNFENQNFDSNLDLSNVPSADVTVTLTQIDPKLEACVNFITRKPSYPISNLSSLIKNLDSLNKAEPSSNTDEPAQGNLVEETRIPDCETLQSTYRPFNNKVTMRNDEFLPFQNSVPTIPFPVKLLSYSLVIIIDSIIFQVLPNEGKFNFRFYHPAASEVVTTSVNDLKVMDEVHHFSSPIVTTLNFKLMPNDEQNFFKNPLQIFILHSSRTFAQASFFIPSVDKKEYNCVGVLEASSSSDCPKSVGFLYLTLCLKHNSLSGSKEKVDSIPSKSVDNEEYMYKVVEELEDWKEKQQLMFKHELKQKEESYLKSLFREWEKQRKEHEYRLTSDLKSCESLKQTLNNAIEEFHLRIHRIMEKEAKLIEEAAEQERTKLLQQQKLAEIMEKLDEAIKTNKTLDEKLKAANESKTFFKEQWGKAVREIHRLKSDISCGFISKKGFEDASGKRSEEKSMKFSESLLKKLDSRLEINSDIDDFDIHHVEYNPSDFNGQTLTELVKERSSIMKSDLLPTEQEAAISKINRRIQHLLSPTH